MKNKRQGSALVMVLISALVIGMITASILTLANGQRRVNIRKELQLQANNAAEASVDYAYSYLINEINAKTLAFAPSVPKTGASTFTLPANALTLISDDIAAPVGYTGATSRVKVSSSEVKVVAPAVDPIRFFVSPQDPANANDPNINQWVQEQTVPLISKVTVQQGNETATSYVHRGVSVREIYLFQHAIFFSGQLQLHRGFRPLGDVHSNGPLLINAHVGDVAKYTGFITTASKFYRGSTIDDGGSGGDAYGYTRVNAAGELDFASGLVKPSATGEGITIFTGKSGAVDQYATLTKTFDSRMTGWKDKAIETFKGHLKDISHQAPQLVPIGSSGYRLDAPGTTNVNEFNNGPYSLIEPLLPADHAARKQDTANKLNLEANASLILRVEVRRDLLTMRDPHTTDPTATQGVIKLYGGSNRAGRAIYKSGAYHYPYVLTPSKALATGELVYRASDLKNASNIADAFVVKAYKNANAGNSTSALSLVALKLPPGVVGAATVDNPAAPTRFLIDGRGPGATATSGVPPANTYQPALALRNAVFEPYSSVFTDNDLSWTTKSVKGQTVYTYSFTVPPINADATPNTPMISSGLHDARLGRGVDLLSIDLGKLKTVMETPIASLTGEDREFREKFTNWNGIIYVEFPTSLDIDFDEATLEDTPANDTKRNTMPPYDSYAFKPGAAETRHPDRAAATDSRPARTDRIVPIAPELRRYPSSGDSQDIGSRFYAIPAVQLINAKELPNPTGSPGFTIATNAPIYLVGSYNSDGDYATGTKILSTGATDYAEKDVNEVPAALFCDTFTALSDTWVTNRKKSFYGWGSDSTKRPVAMDGTKRIEIGACIATGEYPIFEFFFHSLENYAAFNGSINPIIVKGSVVGMFHSEIQHIKQAYGRGETNDIEDYWNAHGAHAFTSVRYHKDLTLGIFPPGTPRAQVTYQVGYRLLRAGDAEDKALLQQAGFL